MQPAITTGEWLRRAAQAWSEAEAAQDPAARYAKVQLAQGFERIARHAAYLAYGDTNLWRCRPDTAGTRRDLAALTRRLCAACARNLPESPLAGMRRRMLDQWIRGAKPDCG